MLVQKLSLLVILNLLRESLVPEVLLYHLFLTHAGIPDHVMDHSGLDPDVVSLCDWQCLGHGA